MEAMPNKLCPTAIRAKDFLAPDATPEVALSVRPSSGGRRLDIMGNTIPSLEDPRMFASKLISRQTPPVLLLRWRFKLKL